MSEFYVRKRLAPEKVQRLLQMRNEEHKSQAEIAAALGISRWTVYWYSSAHGVGGAPGPKEGFPPGPPRCMTCNSVLWPVDGKIRVRVVSEAGVDGPDRLQFCKRWSCVAEYAQRRAQLEGPLPA